MQLGLSTRSNSLENQSWSQRVRERVSQWDSQRVSAELPVSVRELVVLGGSCIVPNSLQVVSKAVVGGLQIDTVAVLSKLHSLFPSAQRLCTRAGYS